MIDICEQFFQTFDEFLTPTEVEFHIPCFPLGYELPASISDDTKLKTAQKTFRNSNGIGFEDVLSATDIEDCPARWLPRITFNGTRVLIELEDGPVLADRTNHTVEYKKKQSVGQDPTRDPIELVLLHGPNNWVSSSDSEFATSIIVRTLSDIWFEDSKIGQENARNLAAFLERIDQTLPVANIDRSMDWQPIEQLEAIY